MAHIDLFLPFAICGAILAKNMHEPCATIPHSRTRAVLRRLAACETID